LLLYPLCLTSRLTLNRSFYDSETRICAGGTRPGTRIDAEYAQDLDRGRRRRTA
jgi:hypothetical protein